MTIWNVTPNKKAIELWQKKTIDSTLHIEIDEIGDRHVKAHMPVNERVHQPFGVLHGGASVVLAESVGLFASHLVIDIEKFYCICVEVNANHIRPVKSGIVFATAKPLHLGRRTHVWSIDINTGEGKLTTAARMTLAVVEHGKKPRIMEERFSALV